ncbi:MAG TPA: glycoside hydrolase family 172 protein [Tepidisphaeraceae bacterium]
MLVPTGARAEQQELKWPDLARRMIDLEHLARLPDAGETSAMQSSYDRASRYDTSGDRYVRWDANADGDGFIRKEGGDTIMAEMKGPGVVWRIWSAEVRTGNVRIYIDDQPEPVIDMPFAHYFDAQHAPFNYASMSYQTPITPGEFAASGNLGGGRNLYFPIPYQKSCKIVAGPNWGRYFQITYTSFSKGARVPSFTRELPADAVAALKQTDEVLRTRLGEDPAGPRQDAQTVEQTVKLEPGATATIAQISGPRAITSLKVKAPALDRATQMDVMRNVAIRMRWDGQTEPAVWSPIGDFFGTAPGINDFRTLLSGAHGNELYANWYMPFERHAVIEIVNDGKTLQEFGFTIKHAPLKNGFAGLGHFHAKWHRGGLPVRKDRWPDWLVLNTQGRGRFCGMALHVWNPRYGNAPESIAGPGFYWWGEGDEKFHVDGEKFPSTFGTGTEDYFGYAWCDPAVFQQAFHAQSLSEANAGHQSLVRHQVAENVPFQQSFEAYLEKYFPDNYPTRFAAIAYWYLSPDGKDPHGTVPVEQRTGYYEQPKIVAGGYRIAPGARGSISTQSMTGFAGSKWKDDDQLWWTRAKPGDKLDIIIPNEKAGQRQVLVTLTKSWNYAIVQFYLNGKKMGNPVDLFSKTVLKSKPIDLGVHPLEPGEQKLTVEIVGSNPQAQPEHMFGLDEVILRPR